MLGWFMRRIARRRLDTFERTFDYDASYMRDMLHTSTTGFMRFTPIAKMAAFREDVPVDAWYAAKLTASVAADCGPCTQLVVRMAEADGVPADVLHGILQRDEQATGPQAWLGVRFADAVLAHDPQADLLRERIAARWGDKAVLSLALSIASAAVFPTVKYALGRGKACVRVRVGNGFATPRAVSV